MNHLDMSIRILVSFLCWSNAGVHIYSLNSWEFIGITDSLSLIVSVSLLATLPIVVRVTVSFEPCYFPIFLV